MLCPKGKCFRALASLCDLTYRLLKWFATCLVVVIMPYEQKETFTGTLEKRWSEFIFNKILDQLNKNWFHHSCCSLNFMNQNDYFNIKLPLIWMNSLSRHATVCQSDWTIQFQTTVKVRIHRKTPAIKFFSAKMRPRLF